MRPPLTELGRADRDLIALDREILELRRNLRRLRDTPALSAAHAVRQAEMASMCRRQLDELEADRPDYVARVEAELGSSAPYKPLPPIRCGCDYCRGVPGAVFEP